MKQVWMAAGHSGFFLGETDGIGPLLELTAQYADLAEFEIHPVLESEQAVPVLQRGFEYGASH